MTKTAITNFCRFVKKGNKGNYYTLYQDCTTSEFTDCNSYIQGKKEFVSVKCQQGWTIKDYEYLIAEKRWISDF